MKTKNTIFIVLLMLLGLSSMANIINVPADYSSIQSAINAANTGDTILVQEGTYNENLNYNGKNVVIGSLFITTDDESYIATTIINGGGSGSCVTFNSGESAAAVLSGFTITNGYSYYGGGIRCHSASSPTLSHLVIHDNSGDFGDSYGGGLSCLSESEPTCSYIVFSSNTAASGGAVYCHDNGNATFSNCEFYDNYANWGGAIQMNFSHPEFYQAVIYNNEAETAGAGVYVFNHSHPTFSNSTIVNNTTVGWGGGFYCNSIYGDPIITNCIVWGNTSDYGLQIFANSGGIAVTYSDVQDGEGEFWFSEHCIDADPLFSDGANNDFTLTEDSPCIDAGDPNSPVDPDGSVADMGAYPFFSAMTANFSADITILCAGGQVQFSDASTGEPDSWSWVFEGGDPETSTAQNPIVVYAEAGDFDVQLSVDNGSESDTYLLENYIHVAPQPQPVISGETDVCENNAKEYMVDYSEGNTYEWAVSGGSIVDGAGTNQITVLWGDAGNASLDLIETANENCQTNAETFTVLIDECIGLGEVSSYTNNLYIYPNPASHQLSLNTNQNMLQIRIFNLSGQLVSSKKLNAQEYQYDLNGIDAGVYIIAVETTNGNFKERLVLKK